MGARRSDEPCEGYDRFHECESDYYCPCDRTHLHTDTRGTEPVKRAAIIPTRNRVQDFSDCVAAIRPQVDTVVAVAHGAMAEGYAMANPDVDIVVYYAMAEPNISTMWRLGIDAAKQAGARWTAILNDDAIVSGNWMDVLIEKALSLQAAGASAPRAEGSRKIMGYAFVLDTDSGVMPDERMRWWYSDDAIQRRCESHSWFALVPGAEVEHRHPDSTTKGALRRASLHDRLVYRRVYQP